MDRIKVKWVGEMYKHSILLDGEIFDTSMAEERVVFDSSEKNDVLNIVTLKQHIITDNRSHLPYGIQIDLIREHDFIMMRQIKDFGINIPNWYYNSDNVDGYIRQLDWDKKYMLKAANQARSMGKKIVDVMLLKEMNDTPFSDYIEFNKLFDIDTGMTYEENEKSITYDSMLNNSYYISDLVDIREEYRVIYIEGMVTSDLVVESRLGYAPNTKEDRVHTVCSIDAIPIEFRSKLINFCKHLNKFTMSIDVYLDADGNYGVLEYSTQYGIEYDKDVLVHLRKFYNKALLNKYYSWDITH